MSEHLTDMRLHWQHLWWLVRHVRGVTRDRFGKRYWRTSDEYSPGHFEIRLIDWPGLSFFSTSSGWIILDQVKDDPTMWMIVDVQVRRNQQRGLGTTLVRAGIAFAQHHGGRELRGFVTTDDEQMHPFLPAWYARLGFSVAPNRTFLMNLSDQAPGLG